MDPKKRQKLLGLKSELTGKDETGPELLSVLTNLNESVNKLNQTIADSKTEIVVPDEVTVKNLGDITEDVQVKNWPKEMAVKVTNQVKAPEVQKVEITNHQKQVDNEPILKKIFDGFASKFADLFSKRLDAGIQIKTDKKNVIFVKQIDSKGNVVGEPNLQVFGGGGSGGGGVDTVWVKNVAGVKQNIATEDTLLLIDSRDTLENCPTRNAKKVVGTDDTGKCERLATKAEQTAGNNWLSLTYSWLTSVLQAIVSSITAWGAKPDFLNKQDAISQVYVDFPRDNQSFGHKKVRMQPTQYSDSGQDNSGGERYLATAADIFTAGTLDIPITQPYQDFDIRAITNIACCYAALSGSVASPAIVKVEVVIYDVESNAYQTIDMPEFSVAASELQSKTEKSFKVHQTAEWDRDRNQYGYIRFSVVAGTLPNTTDIRFSVLLTSYQFKKN